MRIKQLYIRLNKPKFLKDNWIFGRGKNFDYKFIDINFWYDSHTDERLIAGSFELTFFNLRLISLNFEKTRR